MAKFLNGREPNIPNLTIEFNKVLKTMISSIRRTITSKPEMRALLPPDTDRIMTRIYTALDFDPTFVIRSSTYYIMKYKDQIRNYLDSNDPKHEEFFLNADRFLHDANESVDSSRGNDVKIILPNVIAIIRKFSAEEKNMYKTQLGAIFQISIAFFIVSNGGTLPK